MVPVSWNDKANLTSNRLRVANLLLMEEGLKLALGLVTSCYGRMMETYFLLTEVRAHEYEANRVGVKKLCLIKWILKFYLICKNTNSYHLSVGTYSNYTCNNSLMTTNWIHWDQIARLFV